MIYSRSYKKQSVRKRSGDEEFKLQCQIIELFDVILKKNVCFTAFPAGGGGLVRGAKLKRMGLKPGWPDIQLIAEGRYYGVEVKTPKGKLSPSQKGLHIKLAEIGCEVAIVRSLEEAMEVANGWKLTRSRHRVRTKSVESGSPSSSA